MKPVDAVQSVREFVLRDACVRVSVSGCWCVFKIDV